MRRRGFSLLEIMVTVGLASLLLLLGLRGLGRGPSAAGSLGLAEEIASVLDGARQRAISEGVPVAVGFPTGGGATPFAGGYYLMEGEDHPRIVESHRFDEGYGTVTAFVGRWGSPGTAPSAGVNGQAFDANSWLGSSPDMRIVFTPSGTARSNFPTLGGQYRLLVCDGATFTGGPSFVLTGAAKPRTISISATGTVAVLAGVVPAGPGELPDRPAVTAATAVPPVISAVGNGNPTLAGEVQVQPEQADAILPSGVSAVCSAGGHLTLVIRAQDEQGGPLFSTWSGPGSFSAPAEGRMEWKNGAWESSWVWSPPAAATPGEILTLTGTVRDPQGNLVSTSGSQSPRVLVASAGRIMVEYMSGTGFFGSTPLEIVSPESEVLDRVPVVTSSPVRAQVSSDGNSMVYTMWQLSPTYGSSVWYSALDGTGARRLFDQAANPALDDLSATVVFRNSGLGGLTWGYLDGTVVGSFTPPGPTGSGVDKPDVHGDQMVALMPRSDGAGANLIWFRPSAPSLTYCVVAERCAIQDTGPPRLSPDGRRLVYLKNGNLYSAQVDPAPTGILPATQLTTSGNIMGHFDWSPDGDSLAYYQNSRVWILQGGRQRQLSETDYGPATSSLSWFRP